MDPIPKEDMDAIRAEQEKEDNFWGEPITVYTEDQAVEDGILVKASDLNPAWSKGLFSHFTTHLLEEGGYMRINEGLHMAAIVDLLNQANYIVMTKSNNLKDPDTFFSGEIELPNGEKQKIFIEQNSTGKFTLMLPEDH